MSASEKAIDWSKTTFEGTRREQLRRWAHLPLENILLAIEEMQDLAHLLGSATAATPGESARVKESPTGTKKNSMRVAERPARYRTKRGGTRKK